MLKHIFVSLQRLRHEGTCKFLQQQCSIPGIFGAIDGTHISIIRPHEDGQDYFNRKSFYNINVEGLNLRSFMFS